MDYISREKLRHAMYHEAFETDTDLQKWESGCWIRYKLFENVIDALPAEDVVEVIRCKDCKYFNLNKWGKVNDIPLIVAHEICDFWGEGCKTDKDAYCSFAERRG